MVSLFLTLHSQKKTPGNGMKINVINNSINVHNTIRSISLKTNNCHYFLVMDISRSKLGKLPCFHKSRDNLLEYATRLGIILPKSKL